MRQRHKRHNLFGRMLIVLVACFFLGALYLRVGLLPGGLREKAIHRIERFCHKRVVFDRAVYIPFHGLSLTRVGLFEPDGTPIFRARRVTVNARLLPFLREKKVLVNRLLLEGAYYDWVLERPRKPAPAPPKTVISGQIEVPTITTPRPLKLEDFRYGPDFFLPENVYIERIEVSNARVNVRRTLGGDVAESLTGVNVRLTLPEAPILRFEGGFRMGNPSYASVGLTGAWDLREDRYAFTLHAATEDVPGWLIDYQQGGLLILREGRAGVDAKVFSGPDRRLLFDARARLDEAVLKLNDARYSGRLQLEAEGDFDTVTKRVGKYRGALTLIDVDGENVSKKIDALDGLSGKLRFEKDLLTVEAMRGRYKKIEFDASGTLRSFKELRVDGDVRTRMTMDQLRELLPAEHREKLKDFRLSGNLEAHTLISGSLRKDAKIQTDYKLVVANGALKNEAKKIDWSDLFGEFRMGADGVRIDQARFKIAGKPYTLSAFVPGKPGAQGSLRLRSSEISLETDYSQQENDLILRNGRAEFAGGRAQFAGRVLHWTDPWLQLKGTTDLDADKALARFSKPGKPVLLSGRLSGPFTLSGAWDRPADWDFKMDARGTPLYLQDRYRLNDAEVQVRMKNRRCDIPFIRAKAYGGTFLANAQLDLVSAEPLFKASAYLNAIDLSQVGPELKPPKPQLKGTLVAKLALEGKVSEPSTYRGEGALSVTDGFLWQTAQFKDMGNLPLVKVEGLDWVTFEEVSATFLVKDERLHTRDLALLGDSVDLSLEGTVGFEGTLDLVMDIQYSNEVLEGARLTGGFVPLVVHQAGNAISQYKVSGTLGEPKYDKMLLPTPRGAVKRLTGAVGLTS